MNDREAFMVMMKMRQDLIEKGKEMAYENPDRLSEPELRALTDRIFQKLNEIDMALGHPYHDTGTSGTYGIDEDRIDELWVDFIDWYNIMPTPSNILLDYIKRSYPVEKYKNILCVGDGQCSHLGRKLAASGYNAVSVDPVARREFSQKRDKKTKGKLHVVQGQFLKSFDNMIDWADLIVGAKVPQCAEELIGLRKETVFNISANAEIYGMTFRGVPITSSQVLIDQIRKCEGVITKRCKRYAGVEHDSLIFVSKQREKESLEH